MGRRVREGGLLEEGVTEDVGIIFEYLHLCICVFVQLCICVFVYLYLRSQEKGGCRSHTGVAGFRGCWNRVEIAAVFQIIPRPTTRFISDKGKGVKGARSNCQINSKVQLQPLLHFRKLVHKLFL